MTTTHTEKMSGKKFRFSLQHVLELRQHETKHAHQVLADAMAACEAQEARVLRAQQRLEGLRQRAPERGATRPAALRQFDVFRQDARQALARACTQLSQARHYTEVARTHLLEHRRAEEGLQKLRGKEREQHKQKELETARAFLDEQAVMRFCRKNRPALS